MAIFMPVTNNNEYQSFLKVENPSQILNYFSGGQSHQQQYLFGAAVAADHLFQQIMSNDKKRLCSEIDRSNANDSDSDVSVGQEKIDDNNSCKSLNNYDEKIKSSPSTVTKLKSAAVDSSSTSIKDDDDNSSNESSSPRFGFHANNSSSSPRITSIPQINQKLFVGGSPLFIGNPTGNFQEEILRNSQVYAGELMRHQLVAAAQLQSLSTGVQQTFPQTNFETSPLSDHHPFNFENDLQDKFPRLFSPKKVVDSNNTNNFLNCNNKSAISFQNIHSHLSAITQITNSFNTSNSTSNHHQHHHASMKKDDVTSLSSLSRESSQSPSGFQQQFNKHNNLHPHFSATHQNGLTDRQLKFSIDNILKADFGRRITEPLLRSSKSKKISNNNISKVEKQSKLNFTAKANANNNNESISPIESSINNAEKSPTSNEKNQSSSETSSNGTVWPAWVFCTRYSDRPSSGPRIKKPKKPSDGAAPSSSKSDDEKRPRTAFSGPQLARLKHEFNENRYLTEKRRQQLSGELGLNEAQIKIWFQNKRAKIKKSSGQKNPLALQLMAQGLYNHSTVPLTKEEEELQELQAAN